MHTMVRAEGPPPIGKSSATAVEAKSRDIGTRYRVYWHISPLLGKGPSVLFQRDNANHSKFDGHDAKIIPIFPLERSITIKGHSVRRRQVPMCPAFSLTDYKLQLSTLTTALLDLKHDPSARGQDSHKKYRSNYVQLSRFRSLEGLHLLQSITMEDANSAQTSDCSLK
jgi:hypothetical protein